MKARIQTITKHKNNRGKLVLNTKTIVLPAVWNKAGEVIRSQMTHVKPIVKRVYHEVYPAEANPARVQEFKYVGRMKPLYKGMYK